MKIRATAFVVPAYALLTLIFTWPLAARFGSAVPAVFGATDPFIQTFIVGWDFRALGTNPLGIFNAPNFHPLTRTLTYMDHMIGEALVAWPVFAATGRLAPAYNFLIVLSFVASAWAVYRIARYLGLSRPAAFLSGFLFAFSPYRFSNLGLLNQIQTQFLPLGLFFALRYFDTRQVRYLAGTAATLVVQAWFGWYYAFYLALALLLLLLWKVAERRVAWKRLASAPSALVALGTAALLLPGLLPYFEQQRAMPAFKRTLGMTLLYSADLLDYIRINADSRLPGALTFMKGDRGYWPGLVTVFFAIVAIAGVATRRPKRATPGGSGAPESARPGSSWLTVRLARRLGSALHGMAVKWSAWGYLLALSICGFLFSLGPLLQAAGRRFMIPLPYSVAFFAIPGFTSLRAPCRFAVLVVLGLSLLAGLGFHLLSRRWSRNLLFAGALLVSFAGAWSVPIPLVRMPDPDTMPPVYRWIHDQPGDFAILELPMPATESDESPLHAARQVLALYHGKRRLDGVSGFVPPEYHVFRRVMQGFPRAGTIREASRMGATYIIVHYGDVDTARRAALRQAADAATQLEEVAAFGDDIVYRIRSDGARP